MLVLVGTCCVQFETGQTFRRMQTDAALLANNTQQCCMGVVGTCCVRLHGPLGSVWQKFKNIESWPEIFGSHLKTSSRKLGDGY